jgi:hypothetical protein
MTKLKTSLPPQAQARAQEWFDVASVVAMKRGELPPIDDKGRSVANTDYWIFRDDKVTVEKWGTDGMLSVAIMDGSRRILLVHVGDGKVDTWAPEEDVLDYLKSLVPLELLAGL